jgi:hypothetical protein
MHLDNMPSCSVFSSINVCEGRILLELQNLTCYPGKQMWGISLVESTKITNKCIHIIKLLTGNCRTIVAYLLAMDMCGFKYSRT